MNLIQLLSYLWPAMTLKRFEQAYRTVLSQHGQKDAALIVSAMKATTQALGLRYVAADEAKAEIEKAEEKAVKIELKNAEASKKVEDKVRKLEDKIYAKRQAQRAKENETRNDIAKNLQRAKEIKEIQSLL